MASANKHTTSPSFADRVLLAVDEYRNAPDRQERDFRYLARLHNEVRFFEQRYNLASSEIHSRIDDGTLVETADVTRWIFTVNKLERAKARQG
jgi:hypothetical protein